MMGSFTRQAGASLAPCIFVKLASTGYVIACSTGDAMWGITPYYQRRLSIVNTSGTQQWADGYCAILGEGVACIGPGDDQALLRLGGTVAAGDYLKSDSSGYGVTASSDKDHVNAQAIRAGVSGDLVPVKPMRFDLAV